MQLKIWNIVLLLFLANTMTQAQQKQEAYGLAIEKFQRFYNHQQADSLYALFAPNLKAALSEVKTKEMMISLVSQVGHLTSTSIGSESNTRSVFKGVFEKATFEIVIALNEKNEWSALQVRPMPDAGANVPNDGKSPSNFTVTTQNGDTLYGTLAMPKSNSKPNVVLIIAGSGATDRNCNQKGMQTDAFKMLADSLQMAGIASLRFDKRGVGESHAAAGLGADLTINDFVHDALLFVRKIKSDNRFGKIFVAGHSEGALIGMLLANKEKIDGYISIAGAGDNIAKVISRQVKTNLPRSSALADSILSQLKKGKTLKVEDQNLAALFHPSVQPYLISWMAFEPQEEIKKLQIPVLILQGSTDLQVLVADAENLRQAQPKAKYYIIEGMNHVLKNASSDRNENLASYANPSLPIDADLCVAMIQFCK